MQCLTVEYGIQPNQLLAAIRDGALVNEAGLRQVKFFFPNILNVTCFSHTIDNAGKHFAFSVLDTFLGVGIQCFLFAQLLGYCGKQEMGLPCHLTPIPDGGAAGKS